jgi:hypothetical protein
MLKQFGISAAALVAGLVFLSMVRAQITTPRQAGNEVKPEPWNSTPLRKSAYAGKKPAPAPVRDLSGAWDATTDGGFQAKGVNEHPAVLPGQEDPPGGAPDEKGIVHPLPYTPLGEATLKAHKPTGVGVRSVPAVLGNDPVDICDPLGFPRMELFEFRTIEIDQASDHVIVLNQFFHTWRVIWTDGRELPKNPEPRWNGYSVGKWLDEYTFVAQTVGMDERTWLDNAGRPHSDQLRVEERFHRVDHDNMELTLSIDDPKMYTEPWLALNKFPLHLQPPGFDLREMFCSPSDTAEYNQQIGNPVAVPQTK